MYNIKLLLEYDGTNYHGWQRQVTQPTIQQTLEDVLTRITKQDTKVNGAGRTDAGVHAVGQVANFKTALKLTESSWVKAINSLLPQDIRIKGAEYVTLEFNARYSANSKVYQYVILNSDLPIPFLRNYVWHVRQPLAISSMKEAACYLVGTHDFSSFRASECSAKSPVRTLDRLEIISSENPHLSPSPSSPSPSPPPIKGGGICLPSGVPIAAEGQMQWAVGRGSLILLTFEARSYLQHMVRNIVGTLVDTGRGRLIPSDVRDILEKKDRRCAGVIAPPQGLFMVGIKYN